MGLQEPSPRAILLPDQDCTVSASPPAVMHNPMLPPRRLSRVDGKKVVNFDDRHKNAGFRKSDVLGPTVALVCETAKS
jgi:hypothetical protein